VASDSARVKTGLVMRLRRRHALARWLAALMLLPVILGVIPVAPLTAEQALARDLALAICTPNGAEDQGRAPGSHDQQCVLCTLGCATCTPVAPVSAAAALLPAQSSGPFIVTPIAATEPTRLQWRDGSPPRGPPLSLIV
jgi:hypothetical protein